MSKAYSEAGYFARNVRAIEVLVDRDAVASGAAAAGEPWQHYDLGHGWCTYSFFGRFRVFRGSALGVMVARRQDMRCARHRVVPPSSGIGSSVGVGRVELSVEDGRVDVWVVHPGRTQFACPDCERKLSVYDHSAERVWRHLDSCAFLTFLHASPPRVTCPEHGVRQVRLPWAEPHSRFTALFERLAIDVLAACDVAAAAGLLRVSWDEAWHLMDRAVTRGLAAKPLAVPAHVGVDEKAAGKGQDYLTVVCDLDAGTVEYIADERRQASLDGYFDRFSAEQRAPDLGQIFGCG